MGQTSAFHQAKQDGNLSDAQILDYADDLVDLFLTFVRREDISGDVLDVKRLPAKKMTLISAFRLAIATEPNPQVRQGLVAAGLLLAHFQENIGERMSLHPVGYEGMLPAAEVEALMSQNRRYIEKFDAAFALIAQDLDHIQAMFDRSLEIAASRRADYHPHAAAMASKHH